MRKCARKQEYVEDHADEAFKFHTNEDGRLPISYNLAITTRAMVMCPRRNEGLMLKRSDGSDVGFVALNGTLLGGTLMVKEREVFEKLIAEQRSLERVFESAGLPARMRRVTSYVSDNF